MGLRVGGQRSEPVLWPGHRGLQVRGQSPSSGPGHMGLRVGGQRSEPVLWPGHMGLQVGGQRSEPVLWPGSHGAPGGRSKVRARPLARVTGGSGWEVRGQSPSSEVNIVYWWWSRVKSQHRHQRHNT
ncbi:unnamed protein product [Boreogadus saida]